MRDLPDNPGSRGLPEVLPRARRAFPEAATARATAGVPLAIILREVAEFAPGLPAAASGSHRTRAMPTTATQEAGSSRSSIEESRIPSPAPVPGTAPSPQETSGPAAVKQAAGGGRGTLIVIPAHNEEENIGRVLEELRELHLGHDVVVINDASTDGTESVLAGLGQQSLRLSGNLGYGGAVQTGFKYALRQGYDFVVQMDGDCQHDPRSIPQLLEEVRSGRADVALGSRFRGELQYTVPLFRRWGIALFRGVVSLLTRQPITDPTSGFQALNRKVLAFFGGDNYPLDYPDSDVLLALHYAGFRIREVPVVMRPRLRGQSIHGGLKTVYYLAKMVLAIPMVLLRHYRRPRRKA